MRRMLCSSVTLVLMAVLLSPLAWADGRQAGAELRASEAPVVFVAHDYGFRGPDRIPAGLTTVRIINEGHDLHHVQFLKLPKGRSAADFRAAITADPTRMPSWVKFIGGPNATIPGREASATMNLTEGDYVLICLIPDNKGVLHVALGMQKALAVRGGKATKVSAPKPTVAITQVDFQFAISQSIKPGSQTVAVTNHGTQPHEVVLVRLAPGASVMDFVASIEPGAAGPPRGTVLGGIVGIEAGDYGFFTADFEPGRYGLVCFFTDAVMG